MTSDRYQVLVVKFGTRSARKSEVYLNYPIYGHPDEDLDMDYFFWIVRNEHRTFVIDTGFSRDGGEKRGRTFLVDPWRAFEALGVRGESRPTVVVTHAHYDHIGNLNLFPESDIVLTEAELQFWTSEMRFRKQFAHSVEFREIDDLVKARDEGRTRTFNGRLELAPGIELLEVGGHTPGQCIVRVSTADGIVLLASDAIHYFEEIERDIPFAFVSDLPAMYAGFDRIKQMVADEDAILVPGHDPGTLDRLTVTSEGELSGLVGTIG
ncbi:N-acyl homoserine lactonase family protein [Plantactinospora sp. B6F1]|uniref:MBL fold metallo-hydrolase n=1 Tax=Plantactinospora sp. B6F1 TaxID=3158971 RepID=UPI00102ADE9F